MKVKTWFPIITRATYLFLKNNSHSEICSLNVSHFLFPTVTSLGFISLNISGNKSEWNIWSQQKAIKLINIWFKHSQMQPKVKNTQNNKLLTCSLCHFSNSLIGAQRRKNIAPLKVHYYRAFSRTYLTFRFKNTAENEISYNYIKMCMKNVLKLPCF